MASEELGELVLQYSECLKVLNTAHSKLGVAHRQFREEGPFRASDWADNADSLRKAVDEALAAGAVYREAQDVEVNLRRRMEESGMRELLTEVQEFEYDHLGRY